MGDIISSEMCKKCAKCCKNHPFVQLSKNEIYEIEKFTKLPSDSFTNQKSEAGEEYFLQFKENGDCIFLNENNGDYSCGVYEVRSKICRNYPSKPNQHVACDSNMKMIMLNNSG